MHQGFLAVDKPQGITSHDVVGRVRRLAGMKRVGHAGTLDPLATGVLVLGLGRATRLLEYVVGQPKAYVTTVRLGQSTNTYDADGDITQERAVAIPENIAETLAPFTGDIEQVPPMFSAIKRDGQPLYKLARQGIEVERKARKVTISKLEIMAIDGNDVTLRIDCSTGTYIRSIAHDWGEALGCGGHVTMLRRVQVGTFLAQHSEPLEQLTPESLASLLLPIDAAVTHMARLELSVPDAVRLKDGKQVEFSAENHPSNTELVRAYDANDQFVGIVKRASSGVWRAHKILYSPEK